MSGEKQIGLHECAKCGYRGPLLNRNPRCYCPDKKQTASKEQIDEAFKQGIKQYGGTMEELGRVNRYANAERIIEWVKDQKRKPANLAFTEGPERQVAYALEPLLEAVGKAREAFKMIDQPIPIMNEQELMRFAYRCKQAAKEALSELDEVLK